MLKEAVGYLMRYNSRMIFFMLLPANTTYKICNNENSVLSPQKIAIWRFEKSKFTLHQGTRL